MIRKRWLAALLSLVVVSTVGAQPKTIELDFPTWQAEEPGASRNHVETRPGPTVSVRVKRSKVSSDI